MITLENAPIKPFRNKIDFSVYIETYAVTHGITLMESFLQYCEDADVDIDYDIERCVKYVSDSLRDKLEVEAIEEKIMVRRATALPLDDELDFED